MLKRGQGMKMQIVAILFVVLLTGCESMPKSQLTISQSANGSSGEYWEYEFSCDGVLKELSYETSQNIFNFGPGYTESWTFEAVGEGEVTLTWYAYENGGLVLNDSYSVTYCIDKDLNITQK